MFGPTLPVFQSPPKFIETFFDSFKKEFLTNFIFGFMDNFFMIWIGDMVESTLAKQLRRISSSQIQVGQYSAGIGNMGSDVIGISAGDRIGRIVMGERGLANPNGVFWGKNIGIMSGCLVGLVVGVWVAAKTRKALYAKK